MDQLVIQAGKRVTVGDVFSAGSDIFGRHLRILAIGFVALAISVTGIDLLPPSIAQQILAWLLSTLVQWQIFAAILRREGLITDGVARFRYLALLGSSLATAVPMFIGMMLLILPGVILLARWSTAPSMVIAEGKGPIQSLKESWHATKAAQWPIVGAFVVFGTGCIVLFGVLFSILGFGSADVGSGGAATTLNLAVAAVTVASICLSLGIYRLVRVTSAQLGEVFG